MVPANALLTYLCIFTSLPWFTMNKLHAELNTGGPPGPGIKTIQGFWRFVARNFSGCYGAVLFVSPNSFVTLKNCGTKVS